MGQPERKRILGMAGAGLRIGVLLIPLALFGCHDSNLSVVTDPESSLFSASKLAVTSEPGPSPFISLVHLSGFDLRSVTGVQYTIAAKPGSVSAPVHVRYSMEALVARGYVSDAAITVPVFGLYAGYDNQISMELTREYGYPVQFEVDISTASYVDPTGIYSQPNIVMKRASGGPLGFNFIYIKSTLGSPIILDT